MRSYQRPLIDAPVFRDSEGQIIDYGNRWAGSPPEDTYSVDTHSERFAPLHTVADALITHLRDTYDVEVEEGEGWRWISSIRRFTTWYAPCVSDRMTRRARP